MLSPASAELQTLVPRYQAAEETLIQTIAPQKSDSSEVKVRSG